jgi:hypothetical protein
MKKSMIQTILGLLLCLALGLPIVAQETNTTTDHGAKQDIKNAGTSTKNAAKSTGRATKKTYHKAKRGTKKGIHKVAHKTKQGADKVEDKTNPQ